MLAYADHAHERLAEHKERTRSDGTLFLSQEARQRHIRNAIRPPDPDLVGRWRQELSAGEQRAFLDVAGDLLEELGYPN
jgi:hypothetical protein